MKFTEGLVSFEIPGDGHTRGPGKAEPGFYNTSQKLNRDITITFLGWARPKLALDGFGGSGIRGLRFSMEAGIKTVISERNIVSAEVIKRNLEANAADVTLEKETFQCTASKYLFDFIDVDPYGTAVQYMDQAIDSVRNGGYVAVTATDLSALTGSVPSKTWLRYGSRIRNDAFRHETGLRLLIATFVRKAANLEREAVPILSLWYSHYYRVIFRVRSGTARSLRNIENIGYLNKHDLLSKLYPNLIEGPIWLGKLFSDAFLREAKLPDHLKEDPLLVKYLGLFSNEDNSILFCDLAEIGRLRHDSPAPLGKAMNKLAEHGLSKYGRTQFSPTGIKAAISIDEMISYIYD